MTRPIHMHLSLMEHGVTLCALRNIRGMAFKVPIDNLQQFIENQKKQYGDRNSAYSRTEFCIDKACVYILFGKKKVADDLEEPAIYIGETDTPDKRFKSHHKIKNEDQYTWDDIIIFCRTDYDFNKGHILHIERNLMQLTKNASGAELTNAKESEESLSKVTLNKADRDVADDFIESIKILTQALGYDTFTSLGRASKTEKPITGIKDIPRFYLLRSDFEAWGSPTENGFIVFSGSGISTVESKSCGLKYRNQRKKLKKDGIIGEDNKFTKDYVFTYPSTAASIICGGNTNGLSVWKIPLESSESPQDCKEWRTLGEWQGETSQ